LTRLCQSRIGARGFMFSLRVDIAEPGSCLHETSVSLAAVGHTPTNGAHGT
jgi:hypothetical protein